jgi:hypothetical protein
VALTRQTDFPAADQVNEPMGPSESTANAPAGEKMFVEPTVSVPTDVLEATSFFQQSTIESRTV